MNDLDTSITVFRMVGAALLVLIILIVGQIVFKEDYEKYKAAYEAQQEAERCDTFSHSSITPSLCKYKGVNDEH